MKQKKIPDTIKIGYLTFIVRVTGMPKGLLGTCDSTERVITVDKDTKGATLQDVLLHEILHGIYAVYGLEDDATQEQTVTLLSSALVTVLQDNPDVAAFLAEKAS